MGERGGEGEKVRPLGNALAQETVVMGTGGELPEFAPTSGLLPEASRVGTMAAFSRGGHRTTRLSTMRFLSQPLCVSILRLDSHPLVLFLVSSSGNRCRLPAEASGHSAANPSVAVYVWMNGVTRPNKIALAFLSTVKACTSHPQKPA